MVLLVANVCGEICCDAVAGRCLCESLLYCCWWPLDVLKFVVMMFVALLC